MQQAPSRQIVIAGAGIAGLTAALAFAAQGFSVHLFERAPALRDIGAGIQLSPNAVRILDRLGVMGGLKPATVVPDALVIREARRLSTLARLPLGPGAEARWRAPYLVVHRADLQSALLGRVRREPDIRLETGATVSDAAFHARGVTVSADIGRQVEETACLLLVGADGVWSGTRRMTGRETPSRFTGFNAWRALVRPESAVGEALSYVIPPTAVSVFVHPALHLVAYPVRGGAAINLVAVTRGKALAREWSADPDQDQLRRAFARTAPSLASLPRDAGPWTGWPIHDVPEKARWTNPDGLALIGDAAHAMTPFAAQGAAMAIEDAAVLAAVVGAMRNDIPAALERYEHIRRPRIARVAKRGALNQTAWHASGPVALVRNLVLAGRGGARLVEDLDWLYGWDLDAGLMVGARRGDRTIG